MSNAVAAHAGADPFRRHQIVGADLETWGSGLTVEDDRRLLVDPVRGRFVLLGALADAETLLTQRDWLQLTGTDVAALPAQPGVSRADLVYLEAFEHPVRAVEDRELRERALGGPDTSTDSGRSAAVACWLAREGTA